MTLPNAESALVAEEKVRDYLLSPLHPIGRFKAVFFHRLGYDQTRWEVLREDLLAMAASGEAVPGEASPYGQKYEVHGTLIGPSGRDAQVTSVWIQRHDEAFPRFVTAFPD